MISRKEELLFESDKSTDKKNHIYKDVVFWFIAPYLQHLIFYSTLVLSTFFFSTLASAHRIQSGISKTDLTGATLREIAYLRLPHAIGDLVSSLFCSHQPKHGRREQPYTSR